MLNKNEKKKFIQTALKTQYGFAPALKDIEIVSVRYGTFFFKSEFKVNGHLYELEAKAIHGDEMQVIDKLECVSVDDSVPTWKSYRQERKYLRFDF